MKTFTLKSRPASSLSALTRERLEMIRDYYAGKVNLKDVLIYLRDSIETETLLKVPRIAGKAILGTIAFTLYCAAFALLKR